MRADDLQYEVLRKNGHTPSEAFNETVEEATQSLFPLIGKYGMDYMYNACSTTARRGALDWAPKFKEYVILLLSTLSAFMLSHTDVGVHYAEPTCPSLNLFTNPSRTVRKLVVRSTSTLERLTVPISKRNLMRLTPRRFGVRVKLSDLSG